MLDWDPDADYPFGRINYHHDNPVRIAAVIFDGICKIVFIVAYVAVVSALTVIDWLFGQNDASYRYPNR